MELVNDYLKEQYIEKLNAGIQKYSISETFSFTNEDDKYTLECAHTFLNGIDAANNLLLKDDKIKTMNQVSDKLIAAIGETFKHTKQLNNPLENVIEETNVPLVGASLFLDIIIALEFILSELEN